MADLLPRFQKKRDAFIGPQDSLPLNEAAITGKTKALAGAA